MHATQEKNASNQFLIPETTISGTVHVVRSVPDMVVSINCGKIDLTRFFPVQYSYYDTYTA